MAARSRLTILDMALEPVVPITRLISGAAENTTPAIKIFAAMAKEVMTLLCSAIRISDVVSTAGPVMSGTPMGTTPTLSGSIAVHFSPMASPRPGNRPR